VVSVIPVPLNMTIRSGRESAVPGNQPFPASTTEIVPTEALGLSRTQLSTAIEFSHFA
jgi:hypothetical protein